MIISNQYKDMLDEFIDSLDNSLDIKPSAMLKQIIMPSRDILNLRDNSKSLEVNNDLLGNRIQR